MQKELILLLDSIEMDSIFFLRLLVLDLKTALIIGGINLHFLDRLLELDLTFLSIIKQDFVIESDNHLRLFLLAPLLRTLDSYFPFSYCYLFDEGIKIFMELCLDLVVKLFIKGQVLLVLRKCSPFLDNILVFFDVVGFDF